MSQIFNTNGFVGAIDQGTSSTRFLIFSCTTGELITYHQQEVKQSFPQTGWVQQDPTEILKTTVTCIEKAVQHLEALGHHATDIKAVGITNQRETTILWDKSTGKHLTDAIVWCDSRTAETVEKLLKENPGSHRDSLRPRTGLPLHPYFSALKLRWMLDNVPSVQKAVKNETCLFGTVDTWLLWNLSGGVNGGVHVTDVTNASRTLLMNINDLKWDDYLCGFFGVPKNILPNIRSSSEVYATLASTKLKGIPISGILGDQQAALVGQGCLEIGQAKNTYGTGCFLLYNTGREVVPSKHGLLTTVAYQMGKNAPAHYALEGSVGVAGSAVRWLRDNLNIISDAKAVEELASSVSDTAGCYFVPAFSGLLCPHWDSQARGTICGITQVTSKAHISRAVLEAVCFQTRGVLEAMSADSGTNVTSLRVDGGMSANDLLMQLQSDLVGIDVVRPSLVETTALGAAIAAGTAEGVHAWSAPHLGQQVDQLSADVFHPSIVESERDARYVMWQCAVDRALAWEPMARAETNTHDDITSRLPAAMFLLLSFGLLILSDIAK